MKNLGPCTWSTRISPYLWLGGSWNELEYNPVFAFTATVLPGETIEISVTLTAPTAAGNYAAAFRLQNDNGYNFGPAQTVVIVVK